MPDSSTNRVRMRIVTSGLVQGVGFRYATVREASRLGLVGWVRNRTDGSVEILAEGEPSRVEDLLSWCRHGPPGARVTDVRHHAVEPVEAFTDFGIRRSA